MMAPAGENGFWPQAIRFPCENDERRLRHVLRVFGIAGEPKRDGINEIDVPLHDLGKGRFGLAVGVFAQ